MLIICQFVQRIIRIIRQKPQDYKINTLPHRRRHLWIRAGLWNSLSGTTSARSLIAIETLLPNPRILGTQAKRSNRSTATRGVKSAAPD